MTFLAGCADSSADGDGGESTTGSEPSTDSTDATDATTTGAAPSTSSAESSTSADATTSGTTSSEATSSDGTSADSSTSDDGSGTTSDTTTGTESGDTSALGCGDGVIEGLETCDDGNTDDNDGCASDCTTEMYYRCVGEGPDSCAPIRVLVAIGASDTIEFRAAIAEATGGLVDYQDVGTDLQGPTPTFEQLDAGYDCVFTHPSAPYTDSEALAEALADFVDAGGSLVLGFGFDALGNGFAGTPIAEPEYAPVNTGALSLEQADYAGDGTSAIHMGVTAYGYFLFDTDVVLQGGGIQDSTYNNGEIAVAYRPDFKVVYVNGSGQGDFSPTGDWGLLVANACAVGFL